MRDGHGVARHGSSMPATAPYGYCVKVKHQEALIEQHYEKKVVSRTTKRPRLITEVFLLH